jgi:Ca2+/H+ antiporter
MLSSFVFQFAIMASIYFLVHPCLVFISWLFTPYLRLKVITIGSNAIMMLTFLALAHLFSEKSSYYKVSTMSDSVLPGSRMA